MQKNLFLQHCAKGTVNFTHRDSSQCVSTHICCQCAVAARGSQSCSRRREEGSLNSAAPRFAARCPTNPSSAETRSGGVVGGVALPPRSAASSSSDLCPPSHNDSPNSLSTPRECPGHLNSHLRPPHSRRVILSAVATNVFSSVWTLGWSGRSLAAGNPLFPSETVSLVETLSRGRRG